MLIHEKIKIVVLDNNVPVFAGRFSCAECRSAMQCKSTDNCKLFNYIKGRLPDSHIDETNVITIPTNDYNRTITLVKRAIKLRKHRVR